MLGVMDILEEELLDDTTDSRRRRIIAVCGGALVILYGGALQGGEVFLLEASEVVKRKRDGRSHRSLTHVLAPLMSRFKNETGERNVLIPLPNVTASGLKIRDWIERLITVLEKQG